MVELCSHVKNKDTHKSTLPHIAMLISTIYRSLYSCMPSVIQRSTEWGRVTSGSVWLEVIVSSSAINTSIRYSGDGYGIQIAREACVMNNTPLFFLGLVNYYHRFLPNLSSVLHPLNQLLEKDHTWEWSRECQDDFKEAKRLVTSEQVLAHYDPDLPVRVACDASPYGLGAVLSYVMSDGSEKPVAFASRTLNRAERNYSQIDKEALALVWGIRKFNHYLYGRRFTLVTHHQPLTAIFHPEKGIPAMTAARMQRYALQLAAHDYEIKYRTSAKHGNADGLSRVHNYANRENCTRI